MGMAERFKQWWHAPSTWKDRLLGALVGAFGFFWIGVLGRLLLGPSPVGLGVLAWWALASVSFGILLGVVFPKATTCVAYPFLSITVGNGT